MRRQETILLALVINGVLLGLLFMSSSRTEQEKKDHTSEDVQERVVHFPDWVEVSIPEDMRVAQLAEKGGVSVEDLCKANPWMQPAGHVREAQVVRLPHDYRPQPTAPAAVEKEKKHKTYQVQPGDNLWKIARQHHLSLEKLYALNGLDEKSARRLKVGHILRVA